MAGPSLHPRPSTKLLFLDELLPEYLLRRVLVVRPAEQAEVVDRGLPAPCDRNDVIEFQPLTGSAPLAVFSNLRAPSPVTVIDRLADVGVDRANRWGGPDPLACTKLLLLHLRQKGIERTVQDFNDASVGNGMTEQLLRATESLKPAASTPM